MLRFYPPFFFQRIWVKSIREGYSGADVVVHKSLLNMNGNGAIFGGTIFSSIDPIYPVLIGAFVKSKGLNKTISWLKSAHIEYKKPGYRSLHFSVTLDPAQMQEALDTLLVHGKVVKTFSTDIFDVDGLHCATVRNEIYIRNLQFDFNSNSTTTNT
ncbi:YiiD C-terminal domain-containing protein [Brucella sp. 21LCYQ03]|nr:YiiD C-terminal domain-containing protein [Brucella sp. 21LCYQ03]